MPCPEAAASIGFQAELQSLPMRVLALLIVAVAAGSAAFAEGLPDQDRRNSYIPNTDTHFTMKEYPDLAAWKKRAEFLRKQMLFASGLMPMPPKTPLNPQVFDKVEGEDYSIEKVLLETHSANSSVVRNVSNGRKASSAA